MASFFQPVAYDPDARTNLSAASSTSSRFLVYSNSILPKSTLLAHKYQYIVLAIGAAAFGIPVLKWLLIPFLRKSGQKIRRRKVGGTLGRSDIVPGEQFENESRRESRQNVGFGRAKSFGQYVGGDVVKFLSLDYDIHIIDLETCRSFEDSKFERLSIGLSLSSEAPTQDLYQVRRNRNIWALLKNFEESKTNPAAIRFARMVEDLKVAVASQGLSGVVLPVDVLTAHESNTLLKLLDNASLKVLILDEASNPNKKINIGLSCGIIFKNACVLPDGSRRDYFQASKLRMALMRCAPLRQEGPGFLVGFLEICEKRPHSSVIRRANKFAQFHDAIVHFGLSAGQAPTEVVQRKCLGAFDWLKREEIIKTQKSWKDSYRPSISKLSLQGQPKFDVSGLESILPGLIKSLEAVNAVESPPIRTSLQPNEGLDKDEEEIQDPPNFLRQAPPREDFWTISSQGVRMCDAGCYELREELFDYQYVAIVKTQTHLQKLGMLEHLPEKDMLQICDAIHARSEKASYELDALENGLVTGKIKIFRGLDSGFSLPDTRGHFWAVTSKEEGLDGLSIYVSLKTPDIVGTVVHAYLAQLGVPRMERFEVECRLLGASKDILLHPRIKFELDSATYAELLFMLEQFFVSGTKHEILKQVGVACEKLLIDEPTKLAWTKFHSLNFLAKEVSIAEVLKARLECFTRYGLKTPELDGLVDLFQRIDSTISTALFESDEFTMNILSQSMVQSYERQPFKFDPNLDLYSLLFFCSLRRHAFEEVFLETTDRCPLFLQQPDQAAVFAELWVLGSQCEIYFGIKPRALGAIIYSEYRQYLARSPPPVEAWNGKDVFTAYPNDESGEDDQMPSEPGVSPDESDEMTFRAKLVKATFLTVFCVPAIVDVCLLTFLGRGLYLTAFMTLEERIMANYAILAALLMTAGVTGWSGSTGGFYLYQYAFHNMNHFMVQRLSGGFILTLALSVFGFIAFGIEYSWYGGVIFVAYLVVLSTFLNLLGILATMHRPGVPFKSGRLVLARCLLITLLSPFITTFVNGHDVLIYLLVLYLFLGVLLFSYSNLCEEWSDWPAKITMVKEPEIIKWYLDKTAAEALLECDKSETSTEEVKHDGSKAGLSLMEAIQSLNKLSGKKHQAAIQADPFLAKVALGHKYVVWLLRKESNGQPLPSPYSSTWLVQTKLALANQQQVNRGLKEHSPFLLYRNSKYDLAQNVGLFLVALLDRWVAVSMSANHHVVNIYYNVRARYGIAFGLLYFLMCAVSLDIVLQRYWGKTGRRSASKLGNIFDFEATEEEESHTEKKRWLRAISELVWFMLCAFGLMTLFVWLFVVEPTQIILYFAYIVGYSGVIIFQFNRVFTTDIKTHVRIVFLAAFGGYVIGCILHEIPGNRDFRYNDVIALCGASISASIGTWLYSDFCDDHSRGTHGLSADHVNWKVYSQKLVGAFYNEGCRMTHERFGQLPAHECHYSDSSILSDGIKTIFAGAADKMSDSTLAIFPQSTGLLEYTLKLWENGRVRLLMVDRQHFIEAGGKSQFAVSYRSGEILNIFVGVPAVMENWPETSDLSYEDMVTQIAAEALLHECCEGMMHMAHADATLAELILNGEENISMRMKIQLAWESDSNLASIIANTNVELLRHLAFDIDVNTAWEGTPEDVRQAVVSRIVGRSYQYTHILKDWFSLHPDKVQFHDACIRQCLAVRDLGIAQLQCRGSSDAIVGQLTLPCHIWSGSNAHKNRFGAILNFLIRGYRFFFIFFEFVAITSSAGTDCGRELWYTLRHSKIQKPVVWTVMKAWKFCWWNKNMWMRSIILERNDTYKQYRNWIVKGASRTIVDDRIMVSDPRGDTTGFFVLRTTGFGLAICEGVKLQTCPKNWSKCIAEYDDSMRLTSIVDVVKMADNMTADELQTYHYDASDPGRRYPRSRSSRKGIEETSMFYDEFGRITHGECILSAVRFQFSYEYQTIPKESGRILSASLTSVGNPKPIAFSVFWCEALPGSDGKTMVASDRIKRLVQTTSEEVQEIEWKYDHKRDPVITKTTYRRDGQPVKGPDIIESFKDEYGVVNLPRRIFFDDEDLLFYHRKEDVKLLSSQGDMRTEFKKPPIKLRIPFFSKPEGNKVATARKISSAELRSCLWKQWVTSDLDAITACCLDELILREEQTLKRYWRLRDAGFFADAKQYLSDFLIEIEPAIQIADDVSARTSLAIKTGDLFVMGLSKDSNFVTTNPEESYIDTDNRLAVIFTDTGCFPDAPGGVSNCRRDLVNGHTTIRNYALTESANEYGIPRFQIERNVQMMKNLPLWGMDEKCPSHGLYDNLLQCEVNYRICKTRTREDIIGTFIPLLKTFVRGARTLRFRKEDLKEYTDVVLNLNRYFEGKDYITTWRSKHVRTAWREAWLFEYPDPNIANPNDSFEIERPTSKDFDEALELYISYFFIFSIRVPEHVPRVYQSTHHGISSLFGMILKFRRGTTWGIWDHAIMWRESCLNISPAQCILPIAVQTMLLGAMKLASHLAYTHADIILPCTAVYNPIWETEIGSDQGVRSNPNLFLRKIDPITNGIGNMDSFALIERPRTENPTVVMLSNVQFIKDVKNAILAAGVIINEFGFKDYNLVVYGAQDRQPSYAIETEALIENLGIQKTVKLGGFGRPEEVLKDAWLFMNSSLSEGLPLAIGEAALSGIPIVATEVGATALILTDVDDPSIRYGEVVPPNDPVSLARAQLSLLAMVGPWAKYTDDKDNPPVLPSTFTEEDVKRLTKRMHDKAADRSALGLKLRDVVMRKFNGDRYLREHEQMYWVQRHMSEQRADVRLEQLALSQPRFGQPIESKALEPPDEDPMWTERRWQDFVRETPTASAAGNKFATTGSARHEMDSHDGEKEHKGWWRPGARALKSSATSQDDGGANV